MNDEPITIPPREDFEVWLQPRREKRVGYVARTASCPLANWLRARNKRRKIHVCIGGKVCDQDDPCDRLYPLPQWAMDFVDSVDNLESVPGEREVYGYQALTILAEIGA